MKRCKLFLVAISLLVSCQQGEVLVDTFDPLPEAPRRIGFETFVDKATRAQGTNSTELNDFYPVFNVYGWKTVGSELTCVFDNIPVEYFATDIAGSVVYTAGKPSDEWVFAAGSWYYENLRYWDKMASGYQFSAYAPATASADVACSADGIITIGTSTAPVTVDPMNLMDTPAEALAFTGFDRDYMTAQANTTSGKVGFTFKHLLAKLNIRIKLDESITTAQDVSVQKIAIHNLGDKGYYTNDVNAAGTVSGWALAEESGLYVPTADKVYTLNAATNYDGYYVLEQLIIPQTIVKPNADIPSLNEYGEACIYVEYTIGAETFKSYTPLANIFIGTDAGTDYDLEGGNQYTLNVTIGPKPIEFTAIVDDWADAIEKNHIMD